MLGYDGVMAGGKAGKSVGSVGVRLRPSDGPGFGVTRGDGDGRNGGARGVGDHAGETSAIRGEKGKREDEGYEGAEHNGVLANIFHRTCN